MRLNYRSIGAVVRPNHRGAGAMLNRILAMALIFATQAGVAIAATPNDALGGKMIRADQRTERRVAQAQIEAEVVTGKITIIYREPEPDCRPPNIKRDGECIQPPTIKISPPRLADGFYDADYAAVQLVARGGTGPYEFSIATGNLPSGLNLSPSGLISGTPFEVGVFRLTIRATDAERFTGQRRYSLWIKQKKFIDCLPPNISRNGVCSKPPKITITPGRLPGGKYDVTYPGAELVATGGRPPYRFSLAGGRLPPGLNFSSSGRISGVPYAVGVFRFTVRAVDAEQFRGLRRYSISITQPALPPPAPKLASGIFCWKRGGTGSCPPGFSDCGFGCAKGDGSNCAGITAGGGTYGVCSMPPKIGLSPAEVPPGEEGVDYPTVQFIADGGTEPYQFKLSDGILPPGLTFSDGGRLAGAPSQTGEFAFTVRVTDVQGFNGDQQYLISIVQKTDCEPGYVRFGKNCVRDGAAPSPAVDLTRPLQAQLKRIGCLHGAVDGVWGPGSRAALAKFIRRAGLRLDSNEPSQEALNAASAKRSGFCPKPKRVVQPKKKKKTVTERPRRRGSCGKFRYRNSRGKCVCAGGMEPSGDTCVHRRSVNIGTVVRFRWQGGGGGRPPPRRKCFKECDDCPRICN